MKKSHKHFLLALSAFSLTAISALSASAQTTVSTNNAEPDFLAPASSQAVAAAAQSQAMGAASQGQQSYTSAATGAYEQHYQFPNPTTQQNNLGLRPTGFGGIAPVFGF